MKYKTLDGKFIEAESPTDLVQKLRADSFSPSDDLKDFMAQTSERCYEYNHANIRIDTPAHFVDDMLQCGFLKKV